MWYDSGTLWRPYGMQCGIRLPSVRARIPVECGIRSQWVRLPVRCSAVTGAGYELALGGSQTCNIWLPLKTLHLLERSLSLSPSLSLSLSLSYLHISVSASASASVYISMCLSVYVSLCLSIRLSMCLSIGLSICLSAYTMWVSTQLCRRAAPWYTWWDSSSEIRSSREACR